ncbi:MAG: hypothetical protein SVR94_14985, partial [Pseudomonadota bacterium]|nr:hypothetical protein [Pseudomonadota bacterium]
MKVIAIGAHAAFSTGTYEEVVPTEQAINLALEIARTPTSEETIIAELKKRTQRFYAPKWQSNFLIEFDMPGKRGQRPYRLLVDIGGDARHALKAIGLTSADIDGVY